MEFLGVGPIELLIIIILGLIVVGPERLPEMARAVGRLVARILAWQQQSPEFQAIQQVRQEFQREIAGLRNELYRAKQQVASGTQLSGATMLSLKDELNAVMTRVQEMGQTSRDASLSPLPRVIPAAHPLGLPNPSETPQASHQIDAAHNADQDCSGMYQMLMRDIQVLRADLEALHDQLRVGGYLDRSWVLPSLRAPPHQELTQSPQESHDSRFEPIAGDRHSAH